MKIAYKRFLTVALLGSLISTAVGTRPLVVADDFELQKQIQLAKTKGVPYSQDRVLLSQSELDEFQSLLTTFKEENRLHLESGEEWFSWRKVISVGKFILGRLIREESDMLEGKGNVVTLEQEFTKDQALKVEKFLDGAAQSNIAENRDDGQELRSGSHDEKMVAVLSSTMYPLVPDGSAVAADEYLWSTKDNNDPLSSFNLPLTEQEHNKLMGMVQTFEKENALLKADEEWFWPTVKKWGFRILSHVLRSEDDELGAKKPKVVEVELTEEQALLVEEYMDELGDKYVEENRASQEPSSQNLRGGEEWLSFVVRAATTLFKFF